MVNFRMNGRSKKMIGMIIIAIASAFLLNIPKALGFNYLLDTKLLDSVKVMTLLGLAMGWVFYEMWQKEFA